MEGSEDTGWVLLNATGANPINGTQASDEWKLNFAPGAILENASMEIRVDGSDGVSIQQPLLISLTPDRLFLTGEIMDGSEKLSVSTVQSAPRPTWT